MMTTAFDTNRSYLRHRWHSLGQRAIIAHVCSYFAYLATAWIGLQLAVANGVSPIWPASGVALAMVLHFGPQISIAIFAANLSLPLLGIDIARPLWVSCAFALAAAAEPLISAVILRRWFGFDARLLRLRDLAALALIGGPVGPLFSSVLAVLTLYGSGALPWHEFLPTLETFWFGDAGGIIMLAGPLLVWLQWDLALPAAQRLRQLIEAVAILVIASILPLGLPASIIRTLGSDPDALAFLSFPLIAWASIRLDMKISMAITLLISVEAIATSHWSSGLFQRADPGHVLFNIQLFVLSLNATNQLLSGLARQERRAAEQLKEREGFLSLAVRGSNDGLFDYDRDKGRLWLSPRWKQQLGYRDADLESSPASWRRLILKEDLHKAISTLQSLNRGIAAQSDCILRFRHRNGHIVHILCRAAVHRNVRGRLARLVGTHTDISDLVTARQELEHQTASLTRLARDLNRQRRLAEAANDAKSTFLATMSHEVRTPLNGVVGMLNLLIDNNLTEDQRRQASVALNSAEDMLAIINDILDVTKLEAGGISLETTDCDIHAIIEGVVALFSGRAASKGVSLSAEIAGNVPRYIRGDRSRLRQILMNLVGNAVKFTPDGDIVIKATTAPMTRLANAAGDIAPALRFYLMIDVVDTGIGIPAEKIDRLFERFQQADSSITRRFGGSGLGLTICKQLVELMGGRISVDSRPGFGSTFHVALPCSIGHRPEQRVVHSTALATLDPCRVLVVEDNAVNSALVTEMLSRYGHHVTVADNGSTALIILDRQQFDVVLMDVQMPEMDGITTTQWIRALDDQRAHIPIIALTADTMEGSRERYLTAGFSDYLEKPVRANQLLEAIARHVPSRRSLDHDAGPESASVVLPDKAAEIDLAHLAALRRQMAQGDIDRMITNMEAEFEFELRRLKIAVGLGDRDACRLALQALTNDALEIGAAGLAKFTRELAAVSEDVDAIFTAVAQLQLATSRAVAQLRMHALAPSASSRPH
ncbi:MAG TPA: ATP-binding protein [Terriglobia bacterium]|nr:ATP-binding protein [Terriglobia bacterium]